MTIVLVGGGPGYQNVLNYFDTDAKIWVAPSAYPVLQSYIDRIDAVYEIHKEEKWKSFNYVQLGSKLVLPYKTARCPLAQQQSTSALGDTYGILFSSTISWMVAAALQAQATEIVLLGVDMGVRSEYGKQRDGLFFLLGQAKALGTTITIPEDSQINIFGQQYGE